MKACFAVALAIAAEGIDVRRTNSTYTIKDKILINGKEVMGSDTIHTGCHIAPKDASSVSVCGCAVKVKASLLTECQEYSKYTHEVGHCDCGNDACASGDLMSGYTEKFKWVAASYEVVSC